MRSGIHGTFATLLLMIPVLSIPALAIFGIPQFAPVVASPLDEGAHRDRERRVGQSERPAFDGFHGDQDDIPSDSDRFAGSDDPKPSGKLGDSVPVPRSIRNAAPWDSGDSNTKRSEDLSANTEPWSDDLGDARDNSVASSKPGPGTKNSERKGFDPRYSTAPVDSRRPAPQPNPRYRTTDEPLPERSMTSPPPRDTVAPSVRQVSGTEESLTWQSAIRRLNELDIRSFRLERGLGENQFIFICSYTPADSPRVSRRFEAEADEPLKAVEKVLEQVVEWQKRR